LIDHSTCSYLFSRREEMKASGIDIDFVGFDQLKLCARDLTSLRYREISSLAQTAA
jgi:hypothetical protein